MKKNLLGIFGRGEKLNENRTDVVTLEQLCQRTHDYIEEHLALDNKLPQASMEEQKVIQVKRGEVKTKIQMLILEARHRLGESEARKFVEKINAMIDGLVLASQVDLERGKFRHRFASALEGGVAFGAEMVEKIIRGAQPLTSVAGELAIFLRNLVINAFSGIIFGTKAA